MLKEESDIKTEDLLYILSEKSGVGVGTIKKTLREYKAFGTVSSPSNKKKRPTICDKIDDFDKNAIRQRINGFWFRREIPTFNKILKTVNGDPDLPNITRTSFQRLLKDLEFEYTKRNRNSALTERENLVLWRRKYIKDIRRYRQEGRPIYYLDETWVNARDCSTRMWVDKTMKSNSGEFLKGLSTETKNPTGKPLIVVHIGSSEGFLERGFLCFESKKNTADNHDEINGDTFFEWFSRILPLLKDDAVIVMDNAPYHSVKQELIPTTNWKKASIIQWLESKSVIIDKPMVKIELLEKVRQIKGRYEKYIVDEEAKKQNKIVLRLPPYHCELNPIELAWLVVKNYINNNNPFKLNDIRQLLNTGIQRVTPEMWSNFVRHAITEEDKIWQMDFITDEILEENENTPCVLTTTGETTSDSDSD